MANNPFDMDTNATDALVGGDLASARLGFPNPPQQVGLRPPPRAMNNEPDALDMVRAMAPQPQAAQPSTRVGYNPQTGQIFSKGKTYDATANLGLITAMRDGAFDTDNAELPAGFAPASSGQFKQRVQSIPDYQKEFESGVRGYGANMALLGSVATGSEGMKSAYEKLSGESNLLSGASAAPKTFDEAKFGENMTDYVRQLGMQSVPYLAEAIVTGFGLGAAFKGMGVAAAKATAERAILTEAERIIQSGIQEGVAAISREQALAQAAKNVGTSYARAAGLTVGTYPSAVGDILSNQMDQAGTTDGTMAAALGAPYAGLNLLGAGSLITGVSRGIERQMGVAGLKSGIARGAADVGLTMGGEAVNEVGQEVLNQAGRLAVDPRAAMLSPEAWARYQEAAVGGALLGGVAGAPSGIRSAVTPAEQPVDAGVIDANRSAEQARYETGFDRDQMVVDQAAGTGGPNFQGPMAATPNVTPPDDDVAFLVGEFGGKTLKKKQADILALVQAAGLDIRSPELEALRDAIEAQKVGEAKRLIKELLDDSTNVPAGALPSGDGGPSGDIRVGGQPDAGLVPDGAGSGVADAAGTPVGTGPADIPVRELDRPTTLADIPDFSLEDYGPADGPLAPNSAGVIEDIETPPVTDKIGEGGGQRNLFLAPAAAKEVEKRWNSVKLGSMPEYSKMTPDERSVINTLYADGKLTKAEVLRTMQAAQQSRKAEVAAVQSTVKESTAAPVDNDTLGFLTSALPARDARILYDAYVAGKSTKDIALSSGIGDSAVGKVINKDRTAQLAAAVKAGKITPEQSKTIADLLSKKGAKSRKDSAAQKTETATEDEVEETAVEGKSPAMLLEGEEKAEATADEGEVNQLPEGTDNVVSSDTSESGSGTMPKLSDSDVRKIADLNERGAVWAARAMKAMDKVDALKEKIENGEVDDSKIEAVESQIEILEAEVERYMAEARKVLKEQAGRTSKKVAAERAREKVKDYELEEEVDDVESLSMGADTSEADAIQNDYELRQLKGDFAGVVKWAIDGARSDYERELMLKVYARFRELQKLGFLFSFRVTEKGYSLADGASGVSRLNRVAIGPRKTAVEVVVNGADNVGRAGTTQETVMHELIHAVTQSQILLAPDGSAARELKKLYQEMVVEFNSKTDPDKMTKFEKDVLFRRTNALQDEHELLAWGLTNASMQEWLASKERKDGKTWWSKFLDIINSLINGRPVPASSALAQLLTISENILVEDVNQYVTAANKTGVSFGSQENTTRWPQWAVDMYVGHLPVWVDGDLALYTGKNIKGDTLYLPGKRGWGVGKASVNTFSPKPDTITRTELAKLKDVADSFKGVTSFSRGTITSKLPEPIQASQRNIGETLAQYGQSALNTITFTEDLIKRAVTKGVKSAGVYKNVSDRRATKAGERERDAIKILEAFKDLTQAQKVAVNKFIYNSTRENKWGFKPSWRANVEVDVGAAGEFNRLTGGAQDFAKAVFKHGADILADKKDLVNTSVGDELNGDIATAKAAGNTKLAKELEETKRNLLARFNSLFAITEGSPYAPLRREGSFIVVGRSQEYVAAEKAGDRKTLNTLETDPDHYTVSFVDTEAEARQMSKELDAEGMASVYRPKEAMVEELYGGNGMMGAFLKIKNQIQLLAGSSKDTEEQDRLGKLNRIVTGMYLNALGEASARKSEMRRKGISGQLDMVRAFGVQARADAQFMASVEFNQQILDSISAMRKEATTGENQHEKMKLFNELMKRYVESTEAKPSKAADRITRVTSVWMLATSPAYYLTNLTQPFVLSIPYMAKAHSYMDSAAAMVKAWGEVAALVRNTNWKHNLDMNMVPRDARTAMENLAKLGRIDIGMNSEMGSFQVADKGNVSKAMNAIDTGISTISQKIEAVNRLSTAIAAYRLEFARTGDAAKAEAYAGDVVNQTHGDYSRANAPRAFNSSMGRVALQFRKFQLIQLTLLTKLIKDAFGGMSGAEAWAARRTLGFIFAHMGVLGGLVAMPGYAVWSALAEAMFGDDAPDDMELQLRKVIGNQFVSDLLIRGVPAAAGVDLSGKLGMTNVLSALPYTNVDLTSRKSITEIGYSLAFGATGGLVLRGGDALKYMRQGDYYRGIESLMPSGALNTMKAIRFASDGVTNPKGDLLVSPQEQSLIGVAAQALGFTPTQTSRRNVLQSQTYDVGTYFKDQQSQLKLAYVKATRQGKPVADITADWRRMQEAQRQRGVAVSPLGDLFKAPAAAAKRERDVAGGVQYRRSDKAMVEAASQT